MIDRMTILGGSSVYMPEFVLSLVSHNLHFNEIVLYGRPGRKLESVSAFCQRLIDKGGFPTRVIPSTDFESAVAGAKYVLNHVRVGGMRARVRDEKIPPRFGMIGDESLGAGGVANALRTLPIVMDFAARTEAVNPDCTFINLTNPMGTVVEALLKHTKLSVTGVCDLPGEFIRKVAAVLGRSAGDLYFDFIGVNHLGWIQDVREGKTSRMDRVLETIEGDREDGFDYDLIKLYRMVPTSTASLFYHTDRVVKTQKRLAKFRAEILEEAEHHLLSLYENKKLKDIPPSARMRNTPWYEDTITPLIVALEQSKPRTLVLCVRNQDSIRDLPDACSVEVPVDVSSAGMKPRKVGSCPRFLRPLILSLKESERCVIEAVQHRSYEMALQALVANPLVPSVDSAREYLDRIVRDEALDLH